MAIEIGSLVVRGSFGEPAKPSLSEEDIEALAERIRAEVLEDVRQMFEERARRDRER